MWTVPAHLSGPALVVVAVIVAVGLSIRPIFRYPHMWRYLESRLRTQRDRQAGEVRGVDLTEHARLERRCAAANSPRRTRRTRESPQVLDPDLPSRANSGSAGSRSL
jgi:hypothetical protein